MEAVLKSFGKMCKSMGKAIDRMGVSMEGKCSAVEERIACVFPADPCSAALCSRPQVRKQRPLHLRIDVRCYDCDRFRRRVLGKEFLHWIWIRSER